MQELVNMPPRKEQESGRSADREGVELFSVILRWIWEKNRDEHEFFIEESFPIRWTYDYAIPHGLIYKLNKTKLEVSPKRDRREGLRLLEGIFSAPARRSKFQERLRCSAFILEVAPNHREYLSASRNVCRGRARLSRGARSMAWQCGGDRRPHVLSLGSRGI